MIQKITQNNWNFWTVNLIMRAKKLLTSRQIFRYAVLARTVTKKALSHIFWTGSGEKSHNAVNNKHAGVYWQWPLLGGLGHDKMVLITAMCSWHENGVGENFCPSKGSHKTVPFRTCSTKPSICDYCNILTDHCILLDDGRECTHDVLGLVIHWTQLNNRTSGP